jgi:predicted dehydrogenase
MKSIRLAVVGCGAVADIYHLPALRRIPGAVLTAVVDADAARARGVAERYGAPHALPTYTELPGMVDAALVATPNASHAEISSFLLERGVHVLCEKPMATTLADAERMVAAAKRGGARLMAGQSRRFSLNAEALKRLLVGGHLGPIERVSLGLGGPYGRWPQRTDFRRQRSLSGGGVLLDMGIHLIDMVVWLAAGPVSVASYRASDALGWGLESDVDLVLRLAGGGEARLSCSYTHGVDRTLLVEGRDGWARTSVDPAAEVAFFSRASRLCARAGVQTLRFAEEDPYARQLRHFVDCLLADAPFIVREDEVLAGLSVAGHCYGLARAA